MNLPLDPATLLSAFASAFTQNNRLLKLRFSPSADIAENTLLPWQLSGHEAINDGFKYQITCLSPDTYIELKHLIGQPIEISLLTDSGDYRPLSGWVTDAKQEGADGGMARYTLTFQDLFALLKLRTNNRIFQETNSRDAVLTILHEHQTNPILADSLDIDDRTSRDYPTQALISQLHESDADFCKRKLADEGISYYFDYGDTNAERPTITLVLFDDNSQLPDNPAGDVRYHRSDATEDRDSITEWHNQRSLVSGAVYRASPDYKPVNIDQQQDTSRLDQGETGNALSASLEDYRYTSPHYGKDSADHARYTELRMQAHEYAGKQFSGSGSVRAFTIGRFTLADHPEIDQHDAIDREFILTQLTLTAVNNLPDGLGSGKQGAGSGELALTRGLPLPTPRSLLTSTSRYRCHTRRVDGLFNRFAALMLAGDCARIDCCCDAVCRAQSFGGFECLFFISRAAVVIGGAGL